MKVLSLLLAAAVLVISLPACATAPKEKQECCGTPSCPPSKTCPVTHGHHHKKAS